MSSLAHHGVKGQKWGVRRYQNPDGTRTALGKKQLKAIRLSRNEEGIRQVYRSLSDRDLNLLGYEKEKIEENRKDDFKDLGRRHTDYDQYNRVRYKNGDAVGYIAATGYQTTVGRGKKIVNILAVDLAVNSNYRGQGHSVELGKDIVRWFDRYGSKEYDRMEWYAKAENIASQKAAERSGFERRSKKEAAQGWVKYSYKGKKLKHSSIGGNMNYIYGNTLVLGDSSYLAHHGILGQKWGIRRYRDPDGHLTRAGINHYIKKNRRSLKNVNEIVKTLSDKEFEFLDPSAKKIMSIHGRDYLNKIYHDTAIAPKRIVIKDKKLKPVSFLDLEQRDYYGEKPKLNVSIATKSGDEYRGKGYANKAVKKALQWYDKNKDKNNYGGIEWTVKKDNSASIQLAKKNGFKLSEELSSRPGWVVYEYDMDNRRYYQHSSIVGNMNYIYGNTLVLGDSSYLEHHGIKNQKWGVRRFQNPDGSLTAAGRIRYGVTGAAKAAFKVGKKLGAATASAARAGVKKAQDNAYAKKKEKASQTREGVLKNKKMFTADELKALENRFKVEDEMSEARLRHGQAIARTVSQYANTTRDVLSAMQTGGNAVSAITKAFADIQSYKNAKGVAEAAKEKGMTTKEFDLFLKEKYPNAKKDDGSKKKDKNSNKAKDSDSDNNDDDNPPNNGGGGGSGSKKQAEYAANRQKAQEATYAKRKADLDARESGVKQREDYVNKRYDALLKVSKQRQSEQDARDEDLNRRDKAASERESKLRETAKTAADVMSKLNKRKADLDKKESFLNSIESYRLDTLSEFKKNEEEAARRKKKNARHSAIGEEMYSDYLEHHGIKGQRWGVRRFQNADGSLTDKGRKHYQKKLALEERKLTAANAARGQYERVRTPMSVGMGILGAVAGAMVGVPAGPAGIAAGAAIVSSIAASSNYAAYTVAGIVAGHGAKRNMKKIAKYKEALVQDAFEIQNGVLIYGSGQSEELKHFGLKGMKWGVRRFQNKDGSLTEAGKKRYSNIGELDGSGRGKTSTRR